MERIALISNIATRLIAAGWGTVTAVREAEKIVSLATEAVQEADSRKGFTGASV